MKKLTISEIEWTVQAEPEDVDFVGNCSAVDEETDKAQEAWVRSELDGGNVWAWCQVTVTGKYKGLTASDSLSGCSYHCQQDFVTGMYYEDMQATVRGMLQAALEHICEDCQ